MSMGGGTNAAFGFNYQYMTTAEWLLRFLHEHPTEAPNVALLVEPAHPNAEGKDDDVIDFAIEVDGVVTERIQVKGSFAPSTARAIGLPDARRIFSRLAGDVETGSRLVIATNRLLTASLTDVCVRHPTRPDSRTEYVLPENGSSAHPATESIVVDSRTPAELRAALVQAVRDVRRDQLLGQGAKSAGLLAAALLIEIFDSAADLHASRIAATEVLSLLCLPDRSVAHALRHFDWGTPMLEVPQIASMVPRLDVLQSISQVFDEATATRRPGVVVLEGETGFGKSTVAADFCQLHRHFYENVCWIDCRDPGLIHAQAKDVVTRMTPDAEIDNDVVPSAFRTALGKIAGPFVLVFDGAERRLDVEPYLPTSGCGLVIVTTTNSTGWWATSHRLDIGPLTDDEAVACFQAHAGIGPGATDDVVLDIVHRLGNIALAVSMAGVHFRNCGDDLAELASDYFDSLAALDDSMAIPEGYSRTAFAAVRFAVEQIGKGAEGRESMALLYHASFLAPERIPVNLLMQTVEETTTVDLYRPPKPADVDRERRNTVIANIRSKSLARRHRYVDGHGATNPASDTITVHPLVHEILRTIYSRSAPEGVVDERLVVLITLLYGWTLEFRGRGDYFPLEQLHAHADMILRFADELPRRRPPADTDISRILGYAQLFLRSEMATTLAGRGNHEGGAELAQQAVDGTPVDPVPDLVRVRLILTLTQATIDACESHVNHDTIVALAERLLLEVQKVAAREDDGFDNVVRNTSPAAGLLAHYNGGTDNRLAAVAVGLARAVNQTSSRDDSSGRVLTELEKLITRGKYPEAFAMIPRLTAASSSIHNAVTVTSFSAITLLHMNREGEALPHIDRLLDAESTRRLALPHLRLGLQQVEQALIDTRSQWGSFGPTLEQRLASVEELHRELGPSNDIQE
ncbi:ATP-binding protein [Rhodococcus sp. NPDC003318]|uniref:ATP-binding protein n=1 Tax=Rhodococcus sp. NPDC003318 TaxID=3364503 RepID=UPI0036A27D73